MAISIIGTNSGGSNNVSTTSSVVVLPAGIANGDRAYVLLARNAVSGTFTPPSGWTQVGTTVDATYTFGALFTRSLTAADSGTSHTFFYGSTKASWSVIVLRGVQATDATATWTSGYDTSITIPAVTPTVADHLSISFLAMGGSSSIASMTISGWTQDTFTKQGDSVSAITHRQYTGGANATTGTSTGTTNTSTGKAVFRLALQAVPTDTSITVDVPTVTATALASDATQESPLSVSTTVATVTVSAVANDPVIEFRKHAITSASLERYTDGSTVFDSAANVVGNGGYTYAAGFAVPGDYTNGGEISATLNFSVNSRSGIDTAYRIYRIAQPWNATTNNYVLSDEYVTVNIPSTGPYAVDVSSLVQKTNFYGFAFSANSADTNKYATVVDGTSMNLYYAVVGEDAAVDVETVTATAQSQDALAVIDVATDLSTVTASVSALDATVEVTTDPSVTIDVATATAAADIVEASVSLPVTVDLSETPTGTVEAMDATAESVSSAYVDLDTPTTQVTLVKLTDVNGEPVLPSETEDNYFVSTLRTIDTGDIWWRLNEAAGTKVYNRANPATEWPGTGTGNYDGVTIGQFNGPEGRRSVYFNGAARIEENEPTATNLDEVFYSPNVLEFTFRTDRETQFIMGGADNSGVSPSSGVSSPVEASEFWLVDGRINFRSFRLQSFSATPQLTTNITGFKNLADGNWHHVVINAGLTNAARGSRAIEIYIDGKLEIRRFAGVAGTSANETVETGVVWFGMPDFIGGRGEFIDGRRLPPLAVSQWFLGDLTEVVFRNSKVLSEDQILLQRDNMFGIRPVYVETARTTTKGAEASAKGNKVRVLVIDFQTSASMVMNQTYSGVGPQPGRDAFGRVIAMPPYQAQYQFSTLTSALGENATLDSYQFFRAPVRNGYTDPVTDNERILDLDVDLNMEDYDILAIGGYPANDADWSWYTGMDEYSTPPFVTGRNQVENLVAQIRSKVIAGKRLFVNDPNSAIALGIVDRVEYVATMRERVINDVRVGSVTGLYDQRGSDVDPWGFGGPDRYRDEHANQMQRVRKLVDGLTTVPSYIVTDYFEWYNTDPMATPPMQAAYKYADRTNGLFLGDEFYMQGAQGPSLLDGYDESDGTPTTGSRASGWLAAPMANVKVGSVVTSFGSKVYNQDDVDENPYKDYAVSIVIQQGDSWAGQTVGGKAYINFTEAWTHWAGYFETVQKQVLPAILLPQFNETPAQKTWDFSTYRGTWTGTTVNSDSASGAGSVETNNASGAIAGHPGDAYTAKPNQVSLVTFKWESRYPVEAKDNRSMANRGLLWLASDVENDGNANINLETATASAGVNQATVEAQKAAVVDVPTARVTTEAHNDAESVNDVTVLVATAEADVRAGAFREVVDLSTALVTTKAIEPESDLLNGLEIIRLVLPRHSVKLYLEES